MDRVIEISDIARGIDSPFHDPSGNILITGLRGTGKTVLLNKAKDLAESRSWKVIDTYLSDDNLLDRVHTKLDLLLAPTNTIKERKITSAQLNIAQVGVGLNTTYENVKMTLDSKMELLTNSSDTNGLLITIDEVHSTAGNAQKQLGELGNEIQLAQRRNVPVMAVMAGLPGGIKELLKDKTPTGERKATTFLRRALKMPVGTISYEETWNAYRKAFSKDGKYASIEVIDIASEAVKGYPYLFQLVGYHIWERSSSIVTIEEAKSAIEFAKKRLGHLVHDTALADLTAKDKTFLLAMSNYDDSAQMRDIADKLRITKQNANATRLRLIESEMIVKSGHGKVAFAMPYLRDFLREYEAAQIIGDDDW